MAYTTPHRAHEWFTAAALLVCHEYKLRCQNMTADRQRRTLEESREVDPQAWISRFFGSTANLAANRLKEVDVRVHGPTLRAELKYVIKKRAPYSEVLEDWNWLINATSAGDEFKKRAWVVFFPSTKLYDWTECISVPKSRRKRYRHFHYAPFLPVARAVRYGGSRNEKLEWRPTPLRLSIIEIGPRKRVRVDMVASPKDALWALVYTRLTEAQAKILSGATRLQADDAFATA